MRTIKFRGKCCHSDAWAYGNLVDYGEDEYPEIQGFDVFRENDDVWKEPIVERDTIGQFTGLYDKNAREIYEGDIVKRTDGYSYIVKYEFGSFYARLIGGDKEDVYRLALFNNKTVIVGNIHDNPDLMKGGEQ